MAAMTIIQGISSISSGMQKDAAAKQEANSLNDQAVLARSEAYSDAEIHATQVRKFAANQKSAFLKNGVTLAGSPLFVLEDTYSTGQDEVNSIAKRGTAIGNLYDQKATIMRNEGRSSFIGGITSGAGSVGNAGIQAYGAGLFQSSAAAKPAPTK